MLADVMQDLNPITATVPKTHPAAHSAQSDQGVTAIILDAFQMRATLIVREEAVTVQSMSEVQFA